MTQTIPAQLETKIRVNRLLNMTVDWADELIFPYYDGLSLRNVPHSAMQALGVPFPDAAPLLPDVWQGETPQAKRVVTFLLDGLGYQHLKMLMENDPEIRQAIADLNGGRAVIPLTSIAPSTTAVALTTLWTGATPGQSGITGTLMFLREVSTLVNMLSFKPVVGQSAVPSELDTWGLDPHSLAKTIGLSDHLAQHNIPTYTLINRIYVGSGLTRVIYSGNEHIETHHGNQDFMVRLEDMLIKTRGEQCYVGVYWDGVDALAHTYGAHGRYTHAEAKHQILALRDLLTKSSISDGETLFMFLADHGHQDAVDPITIKDDPILYDALQMSLAGDERHAYAYLRNGTLETVTNHLDTHYADSLAYIETARAIESGYFGTDVHPIVKHRAGDLILLPRSGKILSDPVLGVFSMISRHAGLTDWEMLVPFIWQRF